ncbi:hypothetical protein CTI12_AA368870 [Artemisia annua]|uniref:18S pre-ribosomal assembly protein gar2-related protein n=1 Tax=Artemisia annua TaxID=35608 RepID=A0A2U1MH46_ARTAN|nr:hypothetical protein CTI12_AA368870 [Artemisia annua]
MKSDEQKETMKESPRRYTNPFLSDEENAKVNFWNDHELEHSNIENGLTNTCKDDNFRKSLELLNHPSEFCGNETKFYTDKNVMECELPELLVCYKENAFQVKDICVDEGIPHGERVLFDENNNEMLKHDQLKISPTEDYYMESKLSETNGKIDTDLPVVEPTSDYMDIGDSHDEVTDRKSDASSGTQEVDAGLPVNGPLDDHRSTDNIGIGTQIPVQDSQVSIPDKNCKDDGAKDCGAKEEVVDSVAPNELKDISKDDAGLPVNGPLDDHRSTDNIGIGTQIPVQDSQVSIPDKSCKDDGAKDCGAKEEVIDSVAPNELKNISKDDGDDKDEPSECAPEKLKVSQESDTVSKAIDNNCPDINSSDGLLDNVSTEEAVSSSVSSVQQDRPLPSLKFLLESFNQQPVQSPVEEISKSPVIQTNNIPNENMIDENDTLNLDNGKPPTTNGVYKVETPENAHEPSIDTQTAHSHQDVAPDNIATINPVHRGEGGESSFSGAGPVSGLITYSGPIAFSGSISLRSDSSTTSTRSFAFPILQNEWNSSPVRMAKADRRRLQKHRGWKHGLLCCRF